MRRSTALRRELVAAEHIPYVAHIADSVVKTAFGDYLQVLRLDGASFESADDEQLNGWHERLNVLWRNIASPEVALWAHVIRRRESIVSVSTPTPGLPVEIDSHPNPEAHAEPRSGSQFESRFALELGTKYRQRLASQTLMVNELYLAVLYRPTALVATGAVSKALLRTRRSEVRLELADALESCAKLVQTVRASLSRYEPRLLRTYNVRGVCCSSVLEYLGLLLNGEWQRMPLPRAPLNEVLATSRLFFGNEAVEYRTPTQTRVGALLGIKEYPTPSVAGMYDRLLSAPFPLVLTQSFTFLSKATSQGLLQRQFHRMLNAGDFAVSQAEELRDALDALTSNEFAMGDHHFSLQVLADGADEGGVDAASARRMKSLNDHVALARSYLADTGMTVAREDLALEAAFWAQLPGNFALRPRKAPITTRNFAAMSAFHNFPAGRATGNHWGGALALLTTSAGSPYYFSLHASDPHDPDGGSRKDTGHTFICGPTGSGKTVLVGFLITMLQRQGATQVVFDKDRGLEILVRALGGEYLPLVNGIATGFNPLQLPPTPDHVEFLKHWLRVLVRPGTGREITALEQADLDQALRGTLALATHERRLSRLIEFLDPTDPEGLHARLARWCESCRGDYAWVFDNPVDSVVARMAAERPVIGFDVTHFLDHELTRTPVTLYLFHLVRQLLDGRRFVCWMDEFWRLLADPAFESFAKDAPKTWRKLNAVMCLATQSASDVLDSAISRTVIEQTPTKVFFPNADAGAEEYIKGFGLTEREFKLIKEQLEPGSRLFLVKQGHHSVVCKLELQGFDAELAVISGRAAQVERMYQVMAVKGCHPHDWLATFMATNVPS